MTLASKIEQIKADYEKRQKQIDEILVNANKMMKSHEEGMKKMGEAMDTMKEAINDLQDDYTKIKNKMNDEFNSIKNNYWLKLFGVK